MEDENHDDVPDCEPNLLDLIEPNLWLGGLSAASDLKVLKEYGINHILTIDVQPLPITIYDQENFVIKYIKANDTPTEDLLSSFEKAYNFIESSVKKGGVLVHCFFGLSRSATIILAYLMKKNNWTLESSYEFVKSKRKPIKPNPGFMAQLNLFQNMSCKLNKNNVQYKMFRLYITANQVKKFKKVPPAYADVIKIDPSLGVVKPEPRVFKCKKCRRVVAQESNIIPHIPKEKYSWRDKRWSEDMKNVEICKMSYFIEPLTWMENVSSSLEGKLYCPNSGCNNKLGSFSWSAGSLCPCGTKVCPGFYLIPSKVDRVKNIRSIQEIIQI